MGQADLIRSILDNIECREANLLVWGVVDGNSTKEEIIDIIEATIDDNYNEIETLGGDFTNSDFVFRLLIDKRLIFKILSYDDEERYRSRMAETIRLLFHLRQLFPQHDGQNGWTGAKTLVADYRFKRASRAYPERTITPSKFLKNFYDQDKKIVFSLESLFEDRMDNESFKLADFQFEASKAIIESIKSRRNRGILISAGTDQHPQKLPS